MSRYLVIALLVFIVIAAMFTAPSSAAPLGTSFTYQGKLTDAAGTPVSGPVNLSFKLFDATTAGNQVGSTVTLSGVVVSGGLFSVNLDFGASAFAGQKLWLETSIGAQTLSPRVELTSAPTAIYAQTVATGALGNYSGSIQALANPAVNPTVVGTVTMNGTPQALAVSGRYVYVIMTGGNSYGLHVVDASNPAAPYTVGTGVSAPLLDLQSIAVAGGYAYATNPGMRRLRVIDISNPKTPTDVGNVVTSDMSNNPTSVAVSGRYAYVTGLSGTRMQSIDISNPTSPAIIGAGMSGPAGGDALRSLTISGKYAYAVDTAQNRLYIFDISNPVSMAAVGSVPTSTAPYFVAVSGRYAYVAASGVNALQVFDVSNPASPAYVNSAITGTTPCSVAVSGRYVCVVNSGSNTMQVFDVINPMTPTLVGSVSTGTGPCSVAVSGRYAYVANKTSTNVQVIDITGVESTAITAHSLEAGTLQLRNNGVVANQLSVGGGLNVGQGGIYSAGSIATSKGGYFSGYVGIGTQSPLQKLQVDSGNILVRGSNNFSGAGSEASLWLGDTNNYIKAINSGGLRLGTYNGVDNLCLINDKVGIGTASPVAKLEINGTEVSDNDNLYGPLAIKENTNTVDTPAGKTVLALKRIGKFNAAYDASAAFQLKRYATSGTQAYTQMDILLGNGYTSKPDTTVMTMHASGNIGIGTTTPNYKLDVNGTIRCTTLTETSDERFKTNIEPLSGALDSALKLRGVTFNWKPGLGYPEGRQIGFIAQEVEKVYPELVSTDDKGYKAVAYDKLVPVLLEAVKTLEERNVDLESRLERLEKLMDNRHEK